MIVYYNNYIEFFNDMMTMKHKENKQLLTVLNCVSKLAMYNDCEVLEEPYSRKLYVFK